MVAETSLSDPAGSQSRPVKVGHQPEASLAWPYNSQRRGKLRSVDSECEGRVIEPRKRDSSSGALGVLKPGGSTDAPRGGETATRVRTEAPAQEGESRRKQLLPAATVVLRARRGGPTGV
jgi:hypothetical protein